MSNTYHASHAAENEQGLKFSAEPGFLDKSKTVRYCIIFLFVSVLFLFLHFREIQIDAPELNTIAPSYIVAQVDFAFPDDEATVIIRQNALRDVGKIYQISAKNIRQKRAEYDKFLLNHQTWEEGKEDSISFENFYEVSEMLELVLGDLRFTDPSTLEKLKELQFPTGNYEPYAPNSLFEQTALPSRVWDDIQKKYFPVKKFDPLATAMAINFFKDSRWHFEEDIPVQRMLRKKIQSAIAEKISFVPAGARIVEQGDRVTAHQAAMLLAMKETIEKRQRLSNPLTLLGTLILTLLFVGIFIAYLGINHPHILASNRKLFLIILVFILTICLSKLTEFFILNSRGAVVAFFRYPLTIPLAAILICSLIGTSIAVFSAGFLGIISSFALIFDWEGFLLLNMTGAIIAILNAKALRRRKDVFIICLRVLSGVLGAVIAFHLYSNHLEYYSIFSDICSAAFFMLATAILVVGLLPLLETSFRIMTDVTLMEFMDPNNNLLRRLSIEAPGTYQHSVVVGNLAEAAALAIGANGLFCRAATLYHDIGKMATPQYFTENQQGDVNIHQLLTPEESAQVIMTHVAEGVAMGREAGLPEPIIDVIKEHHGTTLVYFFYRKQVEKMNQDKSLVDQREFRYAGPRPYSKESGIIMIADSFEAASRSLDKMNETTLTELVDRIVLEKFEDGQFDNCLLSFEELSMIKRNLVKTLLATGHSRVKYPVLERKGLTERAEEIA